MRYPTTIAATTLLLVTAISASGLIQPETTPNPPTPPADTDQSVDQVAEKGPHEAILRLRDGRFISGILIEETPTAIVLEIAGVRTSYDLRRVDRLEILPPLEVRYETWRASVSATDTAELLLIAEWLLARGRYDDALAEVETALESAPENRAAIRLRTVIIQQRRLTSHDNTDEPSARARQRSQEPPSRIPLLTDEDINLIRLLEIDLRNPPRLKVPDDLARRLRERAPESAVVARLGPRPKPIEVVRAVFELRARDLYPEITVKDDPPHLRRYLTQVHNRWILNSCATSRCHGGSEAGRLALAPRDTDRDRVGYTNFIIMARHQLESGEALINFDEPKRSPLLNMALPIRESSSPHPDVPGFRSALPSEGHPRYRAALAWIRDMHRPRPDYPIETPKRTPIETQAPPSTDPQQPDATGDTPDQPNQPQNEIPAPNQP